MIPVAKGNKRLKPALTIPTGIPIVLKKEVLNIHAFVADKKIKVLSK